jgi:putative transposase
VIHSDACSRFTSLGDGEGIAELGAVPSIGSVGDSYGNALAETANSLYKTKLIRRLGPWKSVDDVELAALSSVNWFNTVRLHGALGDVPPTEFEAAHYVHAADANPPVGIQ